MNGLQYPFSERPADGEALSVAPGVLWVRMAIPIPGLEYINLWLLEDGDGWTIVDTGLRSRKIEANWEQVFAGCLGGRPVTRILCTHFHPDHLGQAGWLTRRWNAPLWMTLTEWAFGRMLSLDAQPEPPQNVLSFYRRAGFNEDRITAYKERGYNNFRKAVTDIPDAFHRIAEGDTIRIGAHDWRVMVGRGHSPEHACLYCAELNVLISGDQILPRISPHIGVYPGEPEANPLKHYLDSLERFRGLPADTLVLPSHNDPFVGLTARVDQLVEHHEVRLQRLDAALVEPKSANDILPVLFRRDLSGDNAFMALGEGLAHLHLMLSEARIERTLGDDGVFRFSNTNARADAAE